MCGVLGVKGKTTLEQGKILLQMLTHRGQDASGLAWVSENNSKLSISKIDAYPDLLKVSDDEKAIFLVGSTRYPTFGTRTNFKNVDNFAQPFSVKSKYGTLVIVHNGNTTNLSQLTSRKYESDANFIVDFLGDLLDKNKGDIKLSVKNFMDNIDGSYSIIGLLGKTLFTFRDPKGIRPLVIGKNGSLTVIASESVVLQNMGITEFDDVKPGELIIFSENSLERAQLCKSDHAHCMFEYVYFANPCSVIENQLVYDIRLSLGRELSHRIQQDDIEIDYIVPVPDTSRPASQGLSEELNIPVREAIIKNRYLQRTFIMKSEKERTNAAKRKYLYVPSYIKGKKILLVDDSIVRGLTSQKIIRDLRSLGVDQIHFAITCPAIRFACYYGIDFPSDEEVIASGNTLKKIKEILDVDSLYYQKIESLKKSIGINDLCTACLSGSYPTQFAAELRIKYLNGEIINRSHYEEG
jgi:amidophosphoribosyltransferase